MNPPVHSDVDSTDREDVETVRAVQNGAGIDLGNAKNDNDGNDDKEEGYYDDEYLDDESDSYSEGESKEREGGNDECGEEDMSRKAGDEDGSAYVEEKT